MKVKDYFLQTLAVGFFASAVYYSSWLLGLCSVMLAVIFTSDELFRAYIESKQSNETLKSLQQMAIDQEKLEKKFEQWQTELGKVSYRVNQMGDYVGSPRD
jgi:hypothetical protein